MELRKRRNLFLLSAMLLLTLSVILALLSFLPTAPIGKQNTMIINDSFVLTKQETYHQGLGSFHGEENVTVFVNKTDSEPINFTLLTYGGTRYSVISKIDFDYSFLAGSDYYDAMFQSNATTLMQVSFQVFVQKPVSQYPFSWLGNVAKALFVISWVTTIMLILQPIIASSSPNSKKPSAQILGKRSLRWIKICVAISLVFWFVLLAINTHPFATFENWYTDSARDSYTSVLFSKVGFSVFNIPLGTLSRMDNSFYKFVTWPEMPNLYPIGSVLIYLPFGMLLESGVSQAFVFKMEIAFLLIVSHFCLYLFVKRFWNHDLSYVVKFWKQDFTYVLKALGLYILYIVLVVFAANGQFDSVAFLFCIVGAVMFLEERYDYFLLFAAVAFTFKYQAGIFLIPLIIVSLFRLFQGSELRDVLQNKAIVAAIALVPIDLFTAYLSVPFLVSARPELVMNGINAFSPHAQISWSLQTLAVLLTLGMTLSCAVYLFNKSRLVSLFMVFSLLPCFIMPYFQPWYLPFFFVYALIPQSKRSLRVTMIWLIFIAFALSFGVIAYNPVAILDNIRRILKF